MTTESIKRINSISWSALPIDDYEILSKANHNLLHHNCLNNESIFVDPSLKELLILNHSTLEGTKLPLQHKSDDNENRNNTNNAHLIDVILLDKYYYLIAIKTTRGIQLKVFVHCEQKAEYRVVNSAVATVFCILLKRDHARNEYLIALCFKNTSRIELVKINLNRSSSVEMKQVGEIVCEQMSESGASCVKGVAACCWHQNELCVAWRNGYISLYCIYGSNIEGNLNIEELSRRALLIASNVVSILPITPPNSDEHLIQSMSTFSRWIIVTATIASSSLIPKSDLESNTSSIFSGNSLILTDLFPKLSNEAQSGAFVSLLSFERETGSLIQSSEVYCDLKDPTIAAASSTSENLSNIRIILSNHLSTQFVLLRLQITATTFEEIGDQEIIPASDCTKQRILGIRWTSANKFIVLSGEKQDDKKSGPFFFASLNATQTYHELMLHTFEDSPMNSVSGNVQYEPATVLQPLPVDQQEDNLASVISLMTDLREVMHTRFDKIEESLSLLSQRVATIEKRFPVTPTATGSHNRVP